MSQSFADHFSSVASKYSQYRPDYPPELFSWIASLTPSGEVAWDCATGNGQAAIGLARHFRRVEATDASAEQIARAIPHPGINYSVATAERSPFPDHSIDILTVAQAAHWFDLPAFFAEARRVVRPGGVIVLWCYGTMKFGKEAMDELLDNFYRNIVGPYWPPERHYIEERYATLDFPFQEFQAPEFHMGGNFTLETLAGYLRTWSATQRYVKEKGIDPVAGLMAELRRHWPSGETLSTSEWPISIRAGVAPK